LVERRGGLFTDFSFRRVRFHFTALGLLPFRSGTAANTIRGAFGRALHDTASPDDYARLFKPRSAEGPSGLADLPRPFVLRCSHLEGLAFRPGSPFHLDVHFFDLTDSSVSCFESAFAAWQKLGIGPSRATVRLDRVEASAPCNLSLEPDMESVERIAIRFVTPTEVKSDGAVASRPEFPILFARIRDRIATLRAIYGGGPLEVDFVAIGERASGVRLTRCEIQWEWRERRSGSSGQVHPLGGFTGEVEYAGPLTEFLPWLRAAQFTGVGRQTVWGKGELQVVS
jgi:CRISPR-associated endoribonuclease Cas6